MDGILFFGWKKIRTSLQYLVLVGLGRRGEGWGSLLLGDFQRKLGFPTMVPEAPLVRSPSPATELPFETLRLDQRLFIQFQFSC